VPAWWVRFGRVWRILPTVTLGSRKERRARREPRVVEGGGTGGETGGGGRGWKGEGRRDKEERRAERWLLRSRVGLGGAGGGRVARGEGGSGCAVTSPAIWRELRVLSSDQKDELSDSSRAVLLSDCSDTENGEPIQQ